MDKIYKKLTSNHIRLLKEAWIVNGCWWKGGWNFDKIIYDSILLLPNFNKEKADKLFEDIQKICCSHDIAFFLQLWFTTSNYKMAKDIFHLLHWTHFWQRLSIWIIVFILLQKHWKVYYYQNNNKTS